MRESRVVALGLGCNLGERRNTLAAALERLSRAGFEITAVSRVYENPALLPEGASPGWDIPFLNLVALGKTELQARELLGLIKNIEQRLGRIERDRWAPREIDIDILAWDGPRIDTPELKVPHPGLLERAFALLPLAEVWPSGRTPEGESFLDLASRQDRAFQMNRSELVGILNLTPDSFSDGGLFSQTHLAVRRAIELAKDGATVIDVGAESTRPDAVPVSQDEEWRRLSPVLEELKRARENGNLAAKLSVDTRNAESARRSLKLGVDWINDVSGFRDPEMIATVSDSNARLVVTHSLTVPPHSNVTLPSDCNPTVEVLRWAERHFAALEMGGISKDRLILDPGLGFGKTPAQSLSILENAGQLRQLGLAVLIGHSRKGFLTKRGETLAERDQETLRHSLRIARAGVEYLRVHHVSLHRDALAAGQIRPENFTWPERTSPVNL